MDKLVRIIKPAIQTLEKLQGAWGAIASDVKNLHDLFNDQTKEIPPMLLEETELENIVDQWNTLAKYGKFGSSPHVNVLGEEWLTLLSSG